MSGQFSYGFFLPNGTQIVHGTGSLVRDAFPAELNIPGTLHMMHPGSAASPRTPTFTGPFGIFPFDTSNRMPRHVHMAPSGSGGHRYVAEKAVVTLVVIGAGVPHTWVAAPAGLNLRELGVCEEEVVSEGRFLAVFEYEEPTTFFPTRQTETLGEEGDYVRCEDLQGIRFPEMTVEDVVREAKFVWNRCAKKAREYKHW
ncbi:hypothetical protein H2203_008944 [Taxawa tesnikishii (nom. ined.)]|nr:hypothetical protein H2203_008944 [Dothideales sp. JES 119]